jgi:hypothetical protein
MADNDGPDPESPMEGGATRDDTHPPSKQAGEQHGSQDVAAARKAETGSRESMKIPGLHDGGTPRSGKAGDNAAKSGGKRAAECV